MEQALRAKRQAEQLHEEAVVRVNELTTINVNLASAKSKLETEFSALQNDYDEVHKELRVSYFVTFLFFRKLNWVLDRFPTNVCRSWPLSLSQQKTSWSRNRSELLSSRQSRSRWRLRFATCKCELRKLRLMRWLEVNVSLPSLNRAFAMLRSRSKRSVVVMPRPTKCCARRTTASRNCCCRRRRTTNKSSCCRKPPTSCPRRWRSTSDKCKNR